MLLSYPLVCRHCGTRHKRRPWNFRLPSPLRWVFGFIHHLLVMTAYIPVSLFMAWLIYLVQFGISAWWLSGVFFLVGYAIGLVWPCELNEMDPTNEVIKRIKDKRTQLGSTDTDPQA